MNFLRHPHMRLSRCCNEDAREKEHGAQPGVFVTGRQEWKWDCHAVMCASAVSNGLQGIRVCRLQCSCWDSQFQKALWGKSPQALLLIICTLLFVENCAKGFGAWFLLTRDFLTDTLKIKLNPHLHCSLKSILESVSPQECLRGYILMSTWEIEFLNFSSIWSW